MVDRPELSHSLKLVHYLGFGLGAIIGVGWVVYSGHWLAAGGPAGAALAFLLGGLFLLPIGLSYAELTSAIPVAGGEFAFSYRAFGEVPAFFTAWALALGYVFIAPFETIAIGALFERLLPGIATTALYHVGLGDIEERVALSTIIPGCATAVLLIAVNLRQAGASGRVQITIVSIMLLCTVIFVGMACLHGDPENLRPLFAPREGVTGYALVTASVASVVVVVPFFMAGFDAIPQAAEEAGRSVDFKRLGLAIPLSIVLGAVFYTVIILAVALTMPWYEAAELEFPTATIFEVALGSRWAGKLVLFVALLGIISTLNSMLVAASRLLFSLGREGLLGAWFCVSRRGAPVNALAFIGALAFLGPFVGKSALVTIVNCSSLTFSVALLVTAASAATLQRTEPDMHRPYRAPIWVHGLAIAAASGLILLMLWPGSPGRLGNAELALLVCWMVLGGLLFRRRERGNVADSSYRVLKGRGRAASDS
jgi:amino acid transporter